MDDSREANVLVAYGSHGIVQADDGPPLPCLFRRKVGRPCCGDRVLIRRADEENWVVEEIFARRNQFMRADQRGRPQVIAANLERSGLFRPLPPKAFIQTLESLANGPRPKVTSMAMARSGCSE